MAREGAPAGQNDPFDRPFQCLADVANHMGHPAKTVRDPCSEHLLAGEEGDRSAGDCFNPLPVGPGVRHGVAHLFEGVAVRVGPDVVEGRAGVQGGSASNCSPDTR